MCDKLINFFMCVCDKLIDELLSGGCVCGGLQ